MSAFDAIKNIFSPEKDPGNKFDKEVEALYNKTSKIMAKENSRREHLTNCAVLMKDCRQKFVITIDQERKIATEKKFSGLPTDREKTRIHEAAIGILTADIALIDLKSINSEADLNRAMNNMGKALRHMIRMDNSTTAISGSARNFIDMFYPSFKNMIAENENYTSVKKATKSAKTGQPTDINSIYEIPKEIRDRIDETFVENLLAGDTYEMARTKATKFTSKKTNKAAPRTDSFMSEEEKKRIAELANAADAATVVRGANTDSDSGNSNYNT